jgi:hypothetical protein
MDLLAQTRVTVPARTVIHEIPLWQMAAAGGAVLLLIALVVGFVVVVVASFRRDKLNDEK